MKALAINKDDFLREKVFLPQHTRANHRNRRMMSLVLGSVHSKNASKRDYVKEALEWCL